MAGRMHIHPQLQMYENLRTPTDSLDICELRDGGAVYERVKSLTLHTRICLWFRTPDIDFCLRALWIFRYASTLNYCCNSAVEYYNFDLKFESGHLYGVLAVGTEEAKRGSAFQ